MLEYTGIENASINTQVVCDSNLKIRDIVARWPGSAHDMTIFNYSRLRTSFEANDFPNCVMLGDSAYADRTYLMTPLLNPVNQAEERYNRAHISTRNYIEPQIGVWKMRFLALLYGLRSRNVEANLTVIVAMPILQIYAGI